MGVVGFQRDCWSRPGWASGMPSGRAQGAGELRGVEEEERQGCGVSGLGGRVTQRGLILKSLKQPSTQCCLHFRRLSAGFEEGVRTEPRVGTYPGRRRWNRVSNSFSFSLPCLAFKTENPSPRNPISPGQYPNGSVTLGGGDRGDEGR